jgi:hypothetical protein
LLDSTVDDRGEFGRCHHHGRREAPVALVDCFDLRSFGRVEMPFKNVRVTSNTF